MKINDYYTDVGPIVLKDDLAEFLGFPEDGIVKIYYPEIVKIAGHSCATVAGAYMMAYAGIKKLYGNDMPKRGEIKVEMRDRQEDGSNGVSATVFSNITGATADYGFAGLGGNYSRRNLLFFQAPINAFVRFTRKDTNESVEVNYRPAEVVHPSNIMMTAIGPKATDESRKAFPKK